MGHVDPSPPILRDDAPTWCQQLPKFDFQTWTLVVSPALEKSGVSASLPVSNTLAFQESLLRRTRLERRRFQPGIAPPAFRVCSSADLAWPASLGCPSTGFSPTTRSAAEGGTRLRLSIPPPSPSEVGGGGALALRIFQCHSR